MDSTSHDHPPTYGPPSPPGVTTVLETSVGSFPAVRHPRWAERFPWLAQGTTTGNGSRAPAAFDLRLFGAAEPREEVLLRWGALLRRTALGSVVHARQVHGADVEIHGGALAAGLVVVGDCDGHVTDEAGILLTVSVADCVPVFLVDPSRRAVALLHAGWRGAAAGILERGLEALGGDAVVREVQMHLGPAICGSCYEVGGEVFEALGYGRPPSPESIDLRAALAHRAVAAGIDPVRITVSEHCTRCGEGGFFSHRGGDSGRQVAFLGVTP